MRSCSELYQNLQLELNLMEERLGEIERVVISLGNGRLNKNLLSPSKLRETLKNIEKQLPSNYSLLFRSNEALWPYYRFVCKKMTWEKLETENWVSFKQISSRKSKIQKVSDEKPPIFSTNHGVNSSTILTCSSVWSYTQFLLLCNSSNQKLNRQFSGLFWPLSYPYVDIS